MDLRHAPGFLESFDLRMLVYVSVCVRLPPRALIKSHVKAMCNNWIKQFYYFLFLYMTLAIDKLNGRGLSNNARCK